MSSYEDFLRFCGFLAEKNLLLIKKYFELEMNLNFVP